MQAAVVFDNVSKSYILYRELMGIKKFLLHFSKILRELRKQKFFAIQDISFEILPGEQVGFIGPNGAGKSTILGLIAGVLNPDRGKVAVAGKISPLLDLGAGFHPELTGRENIYLNAILLGMRRREVREKFDSIVEFSELGSFIDQPIRTYSSGMLARLGFSVAVHREPEILLIDEILAVGDAHFQRKSSDKIQEFKDKGVTMVLVSHGLDAIKKMCNKVIWIDRGKLVEMGNDVGAILERYRQRYT